MEIAWLTAAIATTWFAIAIVVALVVGRVVRRGNEDALLYGSLTASVHAWVAPSTGPDPSGALPIVES